MMRMTSAHPEKKDATSVAEKIQEAKTVTHEHTQKQQYIHTEQEHQHYSFFNQRSIQDCNNVFMNHRTSAYTSDTHEIEDIFI